jgi:hypothetical protein
MVTLRSHLLTPLQKLARQPKTNNSKRMIVTNFHCWKKVCPNNLPYLFSSPAVAIVFKDDSWYRHAGR